MIGAMCQRKVLCVRFFTATCTCLKGDPRNCTPHKTEEQTEQPYASNESERETKTKTNRPQTIKTKTIQQRPIMPPLHTQLPTTIDTTPTSASAFLATQHRLLNTMPAASTSLYDSYFPISGRRECPSEDYEDDDGCHLPTLPYWQQYEDTRDNEDGEDEDDDVDSEDDAEFLSEEVGGAGNHHCHQQPQEEGNQPTTTGFSSRPLESSCWNIETGVSRISNNEEVQGSSSDDDCKCKKVHFSIEKPQIKIIPRVSLQDYPSLYYGANELQQMHNANRKLKLRVVHFTTAQPQVRDIPKAELRDYPALYYGVCELQRMIEDFRKEQKEQQQENKEEESERDSSTTRHQKQQQRTASAGVKLYLLHVV